MGNRGDRQHWVDSRRCWEARTVHDIEPFDKLNTTAENLAKYLFDELSGALNDGNLRVSRIKVWETEKCAASYYE